MSPAFASTYMFSGDPDADFDMYGRWTNPTWADLEDAIGAIEGGTALLFSSGIAAVAAVLCALPAPGDIVVLPSDGYSGTRALAKRYLARWGIQIRTAPTVGDAQVELLDGARLLFVETPSNPALDVCDIRRLSDEAHERGALVAVDNTTATPLGQRPLALGADLSVCSDTKTVGGHSDVLVGHVAAADDDLVAALREWRTLIGAIPGPMDAWLVRRSLATLELRLDRQCANAMRVAGALSDHTAVRRVRYPGLTSDPSHAIARRQMERFGPVVSFEVADRRVADRFLDAARLIVEATSFGGVHSTAERRGRWGGDDIAEGFIRLSVGCEDPVDLVEDVKRALDVAAG